MSSNTSEAATTALNQEEQDNQTETAGQQAQDNSTATPNQDSQISTPSIQQPEAHQQTATTRPESDNAATTTSGQTAQGSQSVVSEQQGESSQTSAVSRQQGEGGQSSVPEQGRNPQSAASEPAIQNASDTTSRTDPHADDTAKMASEPKPDVSDQDYKELLPKLLSYFNNNREELARAIGLHRSTVDRWLNGKSRPNNSTVLRMRRLAQERRIE